jgi:acetyl esterase/lipase
VCVCPRVFDQPAMFTLSGPPDPIKTSAQAYSYRRNYLLGLALFAYGWFGLIGLFVRRRRFYAANLCVAFALGAYLRVPTPLGEIPLLLDPVVMLVLKNSLWFGLMFAALAVYEIVYRYAITMCVLFAVTSVLLVYFWAVDRRQNVRSLVELLKSKRAEREFAGNKSVRANTGSEEPLTLANVPFLMQLHPYAFGCFPFPPNRIRLDTVEVLPEEKVKIEIWRLHKAIHQPASPVPVMFFVHGGGWKGGSSRMHSQVKYLHELIVHGWVVICCNYRKNAWPNHVRDSMACLDYVVSHVGDWGGNIDNIHMSGASAGGHIVSQLVCELARRQTNIFRPASLVMIYPVTDPFDFHKHTASFPLPFPPLGVKAGQSLLAWFFEAMIMKFRFAPHEFVQWAPLSTLVGEVEKLVSVGINSGDDSVKAPYFHWPRTLIVHGELDSVVPVEQSMLFMAKLRELRNLQDSLYHDSQQSTSKTAGAGTTTPVGIADTVETPLRSDAEVGNLQVAPQEESSFASQGLLHKRRSPTPKLDDESDVGTHSGSSYLYQNHIRVAIPDSDVHCDEFLLIPKGKHSFELMDSATVKAANELVIDWLQH